MKTQFQIKFFFFFFFNGGFHHLSFCFFVFLFCLANLCSIFLYFCSFIFIFHLQSIKKSKLATNDISLIGSTRSFYLILLRFHFSSKNKGKNGEVLFILQKNIALDLSKTKIRKLILSTTKKYRQSAHSIPFESKKKKSLKLWKKIYKHDIGIDVNRLSRDNSLPCIQTRRRQPPRSLHFIGGRELEHCPRKSLQPRQRTRTTRHSIRQLLFVIFIRR